MKMPTRQPIPASYKLGSIITFGLAMAVQPLSAATNTWNGAGVIAGSPTTGTVWTDAANYTGTTFSNLATDDMDFSTITSPGSSLTFSATAGTYNVKALNFGTAGSTLASVEFLNFNGDGTAGNTTLNLAGGIALPKFTGSVVVLGSDLTLNLSNAAHSVSATTGTAVLIVKSLVTGGGAAASFTNASTGAPMILTNNNNSFTNGGLSGVRYNGYVGFTSVGNVGSGNSSLGNASTSANGVLWMSNSSALDYIGVGNQSTDRTVRLDGTVSFNNSSTGTSITYNGTFIPNGVAGAEVRVGAIGGSTVVIDSVISGNLGIRRQTGTTYSATTGVSSVTDGLGTLVLGGANTHSGSNLLNIGTTKITNASALGYGGLQTTAAANTQIAVGAVLDLNGQSNVNEPVQLAGGSLLNNSGTAASIGSGIAASTVATATGSGSGYSSAPTVAISGTGTGATATASLGVTASSFSLTFGNKVYSAAPTVTITGGTGGNGSGPAATATAILSGGTTGTVIGITITNAGTGFTTAPTISITGGTVTSGTTDTTGTGNASNFTVSGLSMTAAGTGYTGTPTYTFTGGGGSGAAATAALSSVTLTSNSNSIGGSGDLTINAVVSETGSARSITKVGAGTLTLAGANTYTGTTTINGGTLSVNSIGTVAAPAASALGAPTSSANGTIAIGTGATGATLVYTGSSQTTDRIISLAGATGGATLDQSGTGLLKFTSNIAAAGLAATDQRKTLTLQGSTSGTGEISGNIVDSTAGTTGQKATSLTKSGSGTWTLSGTNTYTGATALNGGILTFLKTSAKSSGTTVTVAATGTVGLGVGAVSGDYTSANVDSLFANTLTGFSMDAASGVALDTSAGNFTYATGQSGSRSLTKLGANTLTLSGANSYTGATSVSAGTLALTGSLGNTAVTVASTSTFTNNGTVGGTLTVNSGGFYNGSGTVTGNATINGGLAPGNSPGTSNFSGDLALGGTATTTMELAGTGGVAGTDFDKINVTGALTMGGALSIVSYNSFNIDQIGTYNLIDFGSMSGNFSSVSVAGTFLADTLSNGIWTGVNGGNTFNYQFTTSDGVFVVSSAIPEPATYAAIFGALALFGTALHRRRSKKR